MKNFNYDIPTKILFGQNKIEKLADEIKKYANKVLLVYGGGSIKKSGLYDDVVARLNAGGITFVELSGVEPNPRVTTVQKGAELCREHGVELVLAVGGGSVIDCSKVIAAAAHSEFDAWELVKKPKKIGKVLPIASILTLSATGSEMDTFAVITNMDTHEKLGTGHPEMAPKFSVLDPTYTFSVPANQTAAGTVDIMSHVLEEYFSGPSQAYLQNRMAEALLQTCIEYGKKAMVQPEDYEARANLMWASSLAINGLLAYGKGSSWCVHPMEHELSAYYDITHGVGLGILIPVWMRYILSDETQSKFVEYGVNVWKIDSKLDPAVIAVKAIEATEAYFAELGIPTKLSQVGIDAEHLEAMAAGSVRYGEIGGLKRLNKDDVMNIFKKAL